MEYSLGYLQRINALLEKNPHVAVATVDSNDLFGCHEQFTQLERVDVHFVRESPEITPMQSVAERKAAGRFRRATGLISVLALFFLVAALVCFSRRAGRRPLALGHRR